MLKWAILIACGPSVRRLAGVNFHIFDFFSEITERNYTKLERKQGLNILYQICVLVPIRKTRCPPWPLIDWDIFDFSFETTEQKLTKLDRKQDLNVVWHVYVFGSIGKTYMTALVSDWLRHFLLPLWHCWMECSETWPEKRS